ncbi:MAG: DUF2124 domain-containing protein [Thermoprotei archaeon]|nr:MAG: DUF2124 domain-containing protein [Thermoprotei archaeon]
MASRRLICSGKGVVGLTRCFKDLISKLNLSKESKITFFGTPAVCLPFIELLAYAIRDVTNNMVFVPGVSIDMAVKLKPIEGYGYQIGEKADPHNSDVVVLLGGLAMPISKLTVEDIIDVVNKVLKRGGYILGVGFMGIFDQTGWSYRVPFTYILDCYCEVKAEAIQMVGVE